MCALILLFLETLFISVFSFFHIKNSFPSVASFNSNLEHQKDYFIQLIVNRATLTF